MILALLILALLILALSIKKNIDVKKVDVVYTWVDSYDPEREVDKYSSDVDARYRFNEKQELKYSLRSLIKNMNWYNTIYIVVKDGQRPPFINFNHPRIKLVNHSEIIPQEHLPLFNSVSIEYFLHKIPGLSDWYIYFNDDIFVNRKIDTNWFFEGDVPVVNINDKKYEKIDVDTPTRYEHYSLITNSIRKMNKILCMNYNYIPMHTPSPCYKPWEEELIDLLKSNGLFSITKYRENSNIAVNNTVRNMYYMHKGSPTRNWSENYIDFKCGGKYTINDGDFICVNSIDDDCSTEFHRMITDIFPINSEYES